ncbi:MAG: DUF3089 domain-containing protein [Solirubrobacterales bacterium]|nr:DUF3089 domain-containing protein [Solirubrobacterales bacterium]OJU95190.1 MAG: hypothetical protein BGO23_04780 [Solirubrobacterales bacterium 67-14]
MSNWNRTGKAVIAVLVAGILTGLAAPTAGAAEPQFAWLCKPGRAEDPCRGSLLTEKVTAAGAEGQSTPKVLTRLRKKVDCFYVYPTVSLQEGPNANLAEDPQLDAIAEQQASRFSPGCRMFAPIYPQFTISAILGAKITDQVAATAYGGVKAAWNEYLKKYNKGRGIVLIGHSQGTGHLKQLVSETFDRRPNLRKRLVSAVLIGGNVTVKKGSRTGGSFRKVPACAKATELGCVIAYSSFLEEPPPEDSLFGRVGGALSEDLDPATHEVLCVNPARLDGSKGRLRPLFNTATFPGLYASLLPNLTQYETPWVSFPALYTASCQNADGASWLRIHDVSDEADARPRVGEKLGRTWGTHLTDVNLAAGNLVSVVTSQEKAYLKKLAKAKRAKAKKKQKKNHR